MTNPDRDSKYMHKMWGTSTLITDYWSGKVLQKELREVTGDSDTEKNQDSDDTETLLE
jgi:hypothetical protein